MKQATGDRRATAGRKPGIAAQRPPGRAGVMDGWLQAIDPVAAVRGMSSGFSVLVIGSLLAPILASQSAVLGGIALTLTAIAGFAAAARRQGTCRVPAVQGITAAVGAYLLVVPLIYLASSQFNFAQMGLTLLTAVVVGALVGQFGGYFGRLGSSA